MAYVFRTRDKSGKPHPKWRFEYTDYLGRRRKGTGSTSRAETEKLAAGIEAEQNAIRKGYRPVPKPAQKHANRPIDEVVAEYLAWGESQGGYGGRPWSALHAKKRRGFLKWWREQLYLECLADLDGCLARVETALRDLQSTGKTGRTVEHHAQALRGFIGWCVTRGYLDSNPIEGLGQFDVTPKTKRRAMTVDEIQRLLNAAPEDRRTVYEVAIVSGLRANELRSLKVSDLCTDRCGLLLHAEWTKNRRAGFQPLPRSLAERLYVGAAGKPVTDPLLPVSSHPDRTFLTDLKHAKITQWTPDGKVDFHALRTVYVSLVLESGAGVKEAQSLARHQTPDLTMNVYGRTRGDRLHEITERVGRAIKPSETPTIPQSHAVGFVNHYPSTPYAGRAWEFKSPSGHSSTVTGSGQQESSPGFSVSQPGQEHEVTESPFVEHGTERGWSETNAGLSATSLSPQQSPDGPDYIIGNLS